MPRANETQFLQEVLRNNVDAINLCQTLFSISQVLDDLNDGDKPVTKAQLHEMMWNSLITVPTNAFYQRHYATVQPLLQSYLLAWQDSCALETQDDHKQNIAFVLRDQIGEIISQCAYLIGGYAWMTAASPLVREHIHEESLEDYKSGLVDEPSENATDDESEDEKE